MYIHSYKWPSGIPQEAGAEEPNELCEEERPPPEKKKKRKKKSIRFNFFELFSKTNKSPGCNSSSSDDQTQEETNTSLSVEKGSSCTSPFAEKRHSEQSEQSEAPPQNLYAALTCKMELLCDSQSSDCCSPKPKKCSDATDDKLKCQMSLCKPYRKCFIR